MRWRLLTIAAAGLTVLLARMLPAQTDFIPRIEDNSGMLNAVTPTLGGKQFWADELLFRDWRIQRNVITGHYRLLDGYSLRRAWGSFDQCRNRLEQIKRDRSLPAMHGKAVIVLHGLVRTRSSVSGMARYLAEHGEYTAFTMGYPSTRGEIDEHAKSLAKVIANLDGIDQIDFVAHSLGNVVIRRYLANETDAAQGHKPDPRIKRIVMVGAPNNGARMAEIFGGNILFRSIVGSSGHELGRGWSDFESKLATPECEFGVIAGGRGDERGYNPLLDGDDDLVVRVAETRLAGASDFIVLPATHTFMMDHQQVQAATLRFLEQGYFVAPDQRQSIPLVRASLDATDSGK